MSASSGIRPRPNPDKIAAENTLYSDQQFVQRMKPFNAESPASGFVGTGTDGGSAPIGGSFLQDATAAITGAVGYFQQQVELVSQQIHISLQDFDEHWTSFMELKDAATDGILDLIDAGDYSGQILKMRIPDGITNFVINNANKSGNDTGNILMSGVDNLIVQGGEVLEFIFDVFTVPQVAAQSSLKSGTLSGVWRLSSGVSAGGDPATAILGRDANQALNATGITVIEYDDNFFFGNQEKITPTATPGVFKLLAGFVYGARALGSIELSDAGQGSSGIATWQVSLQEGGTFTDTLVNVLTEESKVDGVFNAGRATFTTQSQALAVVIDASGQDVYIRQVINGVTGTLINWLVVASGASIESLESGGGGGGGGGGGAEVPIWTQAHDADGYNFIIDEAGLSYWKNSRELANNWTQLLMDDTIALNISNRAGQQWIRAGFNLEPNSTQTLGSENVRWDEVYVDNFADFDGFAGSQPTTGNGRIFWNNTTKSFHQVDDAGVDTDLVGSASDVSQWANFAAVNDVIPDTPFRLLGNTGTDNQWGGLFMNTSSSIRWQTSPGVFTETLIQGTTGGFNLNVPFGGSYLLDINGTPQFSVDVGSVTINPPTLDFNSSVATIEGLFNINFGTAGASISSVASLSPFGSILLQDVADSASHIKSVGGVLQTRHYRSGGDNFLTLHPDTGIDATILQGVRDIRFDGLGVVTSNKAMITGDSTENLYYNVANNEQHKFLGANVEHASISGSGFFLQNNASVIAIIPTAGGRLDITKAGGTDASFVCPDNFIFRNDTGGFEMDFQGDFNTGNTVPSQLFLSGKNSVGSRHEYGKIKTRIQEPLSGAESGDLELYGSLSGSELEMLTLKARDPLAPNDPVIYLRNNVEMLFSVGASKFVLDRAPLHFRDVSVAPTPAVLQDAVLYTIDLGSGSELRVTFANGTTRILAGD